MEELILKIICEKETGGLDLSKLQLAVDRGIAVLATKLPMFAACGLLYEKGLRGGMA